MRKTYPIIGMSPGNSYFKENKIEFLLNKALSKYDQVAVMIADIPAISTYVALGYPKNRARTDKAVRSSNQLKNRVRNVMENNSILEDKVKIVDWEKDVENNESYQQKYQNVKKLYDSNKDFQEACNQTTQTVLEFSRKQIENMDEAIKIAVHYLLSEFAFLEFAPEYFNQGHITYIYHNNWPVYENYVAGVYDEKDRRDYLGFQLLEHPDEMFVPLIQDIEIDSSEKALERIKRTGLIYTGYAEYDPAFMTEDGNKFGIFHDLLVKIADDNNWRIVWTEEVGYGAVVTALNNKHFDIFASTVWPTEERKETALFSKPLYRSEVFAWVREDFNSEPFRIAVKENDISHSIAKDYKEKEEVFSKQLSDTTYLLQMVVDGQADMTFVEPNIARIFNQESKVKVKKFSDEKVRTYDNSFIFRQDEDDLKKFFDGEIERLRQEGYLDKLFEKYIEEKDLFLF